MLLEASMSLQIYSAYGGKVVKVKWVAISVTLSLCQRGRRDCTERCVFVSCSGAETQRSSRVILKRIQCPEWKDIIPMLI